MRVRIEAFSTLTTFDADHEVASMSSSSEPLSLASTLESFDRVALTKSADHAPQYEKLHTLLKRTTSKDFLLKAAILWRLSRSAFFLCLVHDLKKNTKESKNYLAESLACAKRSIELLEDYRKAPIESADKKTRDQESKKLINQNYISNIAHAHTWTAIALGRHLGFHSKSNKEKVTLAFEYKSHIDCAMKYRPSDWMIKYMMGRYMFSMARLSWIQKKLALVIFKRSLPNYSYDDVIEKLTESLALFDQSKAVYFYLGKCYARKLDFTHALEVINRGINAEGIILEAEYYDTPLLMLRDKCLREDDGIDEDLHVQ